MRAVSVLDKRCPSCWANTLSTLLTSLTIISSASTVFRLRLVVRVHTPLQLGLHATGRRRTLVNLLDVLLLGLTESHISQPHRSQCFNR